MSCANVERYGIVREYGMEALIEAVNDAIRRGWQPLGAPFRWGKAEGQFAQAITTTEAGE